MSRVPDPTDARARLVVVTDLGRELVELSVPVVREIAGADVMVRTHQQRSEFPPFVLE